jgi:hypothetical protein
VNNCPTIYSCFQTVNAGQIGYPVEPHPLSCMEICSLTCDLIDDSAKSIIDVRCDMEKIGVRLSMCEAPGSCGRMEGFLIPIVLSQSGGVSLHL